MIEGATKAEDLLNAGEAALLIGRHPSTIRAMILDGRLSVAEKVGRSSLVYRSALLEAHSKTEADWAQLQSMGSSRSTRATQGRLMRPDVARIAKATKMSQATVKRVAAKAGGITLPSGCSPKGISWLSDAAIESLCGFLWITNHALRDIIPAFEAAPLKIGRPKEMKAAKV